jgi:ABC-2 type transport system ATP-binding protein
VTKFQLAFPQGGEPALPEGLNILHQSQVGRVKTLIVRGDMEKAKERLAAQKPILLDALPLSLEEIFIYELGGEDYVVRELVL